MSLAPTPIDYKELVQDDRIHASLYTDPRIFEEEMDRIFHRGWVFVGHDSEVLVSNIEVRAADGGELVAESNFLLGELAIQAKRELHWWVGRTTHRLRRVDGALRMSQKKVVLVNAAEPLPNMSFLI
ncbi:MAG TPA: aromatic-ring-hydroxylating dioxygenase subunit beta [Longimicrobiales bacterium]|nr:aromatic-ring-hydroxylating dioxygenase subunit beta [Longimicrobiales bacterium]